LNRILLGVTGSVAAVKTPALLTALRGAGMDVKVAPTRAALSFFAADALAGLQGLGGELPVRGQSTVYLDEDEWPAGRLFEVGDPVLHIELRKWADLLLIAPLDANTLGKLAGGLCDNLLTSIYRAWDLSQPVVLAPAMNTLMWEHPATRQQLIQLAGYHTSGALRIRSTTDEMVEQVNGRCPHLWVVPPQVKRLACGDVGQGGMADVQEIVTAAVTALSHRHEPAPRPTRARRSRTAAAAW